MKQPLTSQESKELMNEVGKMATWSISPDGEIWWCNGLYELYGMRVGDSITVEGFKGRVYPKDWDKFQLVLNEAVHLKTPFQLEARIMIKNTYQWVQITGKVLNDGSILGVTQNVDHLFKDYKEVKENLEMIKVISSNTTSPMELIHKYLHHD